MRQRMLIPAITTEQFVLLDVLLHRPLDADGLMTALRAYGYDGSFKSAYTRLEVLRRKRLVNRLDLRPGAASEVKNAKWEITDSGREMCKSIVMLYAQSNAMRHELDTKVKR